MSRMTWECIKASRKGRLGTWYPKEGTPMKTPCYLLYSRRGIIPHLTWDMLNQSGMPKEHLLCLQLALDDVWDDPGVQILQSYGEGLKSFCGWPTDRLIMGVSRDPASLTLDYDTNTDTSSSFSTYRGRRKISIEVFNQAISAFQLDILTPLTDSLPSLDCVEGHDRSPITLKRISKSVNRSLKHLDACLESKLSHQKVFGVIQGSYSEVERKRSAEETSRRNIDGVLLEGFFLGEMRETRIKLIKAIMSGLPPSPVRMICGCSSPEDILEMVSLGIDLFDSSYPFRMADEGTGWTVVSLNSFEKLNLRDTIYQTDQATLAKGCDCFSCRQGYMRGYIHHLLKTHEMLASVLLSM